jgi:hypothetical protein
VDVVVVAGARSGAGTRLVWNAQVESLSVVDPFSMVSVGSCRREKSPPAGR